MGTIFAYSLTVSLIITLAYGGYRLSRNGSAQMRRTILLSIYFLALVIVPTLLNIDLNTISKSTITHDELAFAEVKIINDYNPSASNFNFDFFLWVYIIGAAICLLTTIVQLLGVYKLLRHSKRLNLAGLTIYVINHRDIIPFSIGKIVVANISDIENPAILIHEKAHIEHLHIIDLCIAQLTCLLCWYCPFVWQMRRELKLVHEFQADETVVCSGADTRTYCRLIVERAARRKIMSIANGLSHNNLKQRIKMMQALQSGCHSSKMCVLLSLLAVIVGVVFLTVPAVGSVISQISQSTVQDKNIDNKQAVNSFVIYGADINPSDSLTVLPRIGAIICSDRTVVDQMMPQVSTYIVDGKIMSAKEFSKIPSAEICKVIVSGKSLIVYTRNTPEGRYFDAVEAAVEAENRY